MKIFKDEPNIKFLNKKWYAFALSGLVIIGGLYCYFTRGFNLGIDFTGGNMVEVSFKEKKSVAQLRAQLSRVNMGEAEISKIGSESKFFIKIRKLNLPDKEAAGESGELGTVVERIRRAFMNDGQQAALAAGKLDLNNSTAGDIARFLQAQGLDEEDARTSGQLIIDARKTTIGLLRGYNELENIGLKHRVFNLLREKTFLNDFTFLSVEVVGPVVGRELTRKVTLATVWALIAMLIYIAVRFKFLYGISAILTLTHDVLTTLSFVIFFRIELSMVVVAAVLTIVGYSINDTIVIFDRLRDNLKIMKKENLETILDKSINQTLSRTIITSGTVFLTVVALFFFGGEVLHPFAFTMLVGVISGSYSTIYQSCAWLKIWEKSFLKRKKV